MKNSRAPFKISMPNSSYSTLQKTVKQLAAKIDAPSNLLPTYARTRDSAYPHIEIDESGLLHYVVVERGEELERLSTKDEDELLYWVFAGVTFSMAVAYELKNRIYKQDARRIMFGKQEELLGKLSQNWKQREIAEHENILKKNPFDDNINLRVDAYVALIEDGHSIESATKISDENFSETPSPQSKIAKIWNRFVG